MLLYLLKTTFCLVLFLGFYHLVLEKEKMHRFNRFYLLGSIVFAFLVPSFTITVSTTEFIEPIVQEYQMVDQMQTTSIASIEEAEINYINYATGLYLLISGILIFYFVKNLHKILLKTRKNEKVNYYTATVILLKEKILPHTFLKYIFINKDEYINDKSEQLILTHELEHVKQKHSLDILFIELLQIAFWFIPLFRFYKKVIQLNHEFLADDAVIKEHKNISEYQHLLLNVSTQENNIYLASNLNYSLTKKRLVMMTKPSSKTNILLKKLLVLPLTAGFIFAFAQRIEAKETKNEKPQIVVVETEDNGISEKEMNEYKELMTTTKKSKIFIYKQLNRMKELYKRMSVKQQNSVEDVFKLAPPLPKITYKKKVPTKTQFNSWKNKEQFALWIDGKVVDNSVLNNYKNTDFSYFSGSKVYKNARNKRFPQEYQFHLYTKKEFAKMKAKEAQEDKNTVRILINKNGGLLVNGKVTSIQKLKEVLDKIDIDKDKAHVVINGDKSTKVGDVTDIKMILRKSEFYKISINNKLLPPPPPMNIVQRYKQLFDKGSESKIYKEKDVEKMISLYKKMSQKQQQSVTDIRKVIPPPPPPIDIVFTYKKLAKRIQSTPKNRKANVIYLKELYNKMNASQKKKVTKPSRVLPPPPPKKKENEMAETPVINENHASSNQWVEIVELLQTAPGKIDGKAIPPPPLLKKNATKKETERYNKAFTYWKKKTQNPLKIEKATRIKTILSYIKNLNKRGAKFTYNAKPITFKKATKLVKEKNIHNLYSVENKDKTIEVNLSDKPFVK